MNIIKMARDVGFHVGDQFVAGASEDDLERFAALVASAEREACARVCDEFSKQIRFYNFSDFVAKAIRARGQA